MLSHGSACVPVSDIMHAHKSFHTIRDSAHVEIKLQSLKLQRLVTLAVVCAGTDSTSPTIYHETLVLVCCVGPGHVQRQAGHRSHAFANKTAQLVHNVQQQRVCT